MEYINFNGKIITHNTPIFIANNRGLRYGDGLFETIKMKNEKIILAQAHFDRLWLGMHLLQFDIPKLFTINVLQNQIHILAKKNKLKDARIRLMVSRGSGGLYDATSHQPNYVIEITSLPSASGQLNVNGIEICIYKDAIKSIDAFSNSKTNNYLPYLMGALFAKKMCCNDAIILNSQGYICDTTLANIFYIKNKQYYTPALSQGCVAGVMRQWLIDILIQMGIVVNETIITEQQLMEADEVFLTNSIYNIRWVGQLGSKKYTNQNIQQLVTTLSQKMPIIFS